MRRGGILSRNGRTIAVVLGAAALAISTGMQVSTQSQALSLTPIGTYETRIFDRGASEIVEYDPDTKRVFVVNAQPAGVDVLDASIPATPRKIAFIDASAFGGTVNSVDVSRGVLGVAIEANVVTNPGTAAFYRTSTLELLGSAATGVLPDMITFSPDGRFALTANEGQPNASYTIDPEGSVTVIDRRYCHLRHHRSACADLRRLHEQPRLHGKHPAIHGGRPWARRHCLRAGKNQSDGPADARRRQRGQREHHVLQHRRAVVCAQVKRKTVMHECAARVFTPCDSSGRLRRLIGSCRGASAQKSPSRTSWSDSGQPCDEGRPFSEHQSEPNRDLSPGTTLPPRS